MTVAPRWPDVLDGLLAILPALPEFAGVQVSDGLPTTVDKPQDWVTVGFVTDEGAGRFVQLADPSGFATQEEGDVRCHLAANAGDADPRLARARAFEIVAAWQAALKADPTLGGRLPSGSVLALEAQVEAVQNRAGSATALLITVNYSTLTYDT